MVVGGWRRLTASGLLRGVGPELVSTASDNDPTNVGTAASVGAHAGYQLAWIALLVAPLLGVVQVIAAKLAVAAQDDLQSLAVKRYGRGIGLVFLLTVVVVNLITIAADLQAGAAGLGLLIGIGARWLVVPLGLVIGALLIMGSYRQAAGVLRYLLLGFLAFGAAAVLARPDWSSVLSGSLIPSLSAARGQLPDALALLGTTLTSYVYVWQTIGRGIEEPPGRDARSLGRITAGAVVGAVFTALVLWFMLVAAAATLGRRHLPVLTAGDAARALRPLAGPAAADLFAIGLVASALVALPVLIAATAYVAGAYFGWRRGLSEGLGAAPGFYAALASSIALAMGASLAGIPVFGMLVAASIAGGIGTPVGMVLLVRLARDPEIMGSQPIHPGLAAAGWAAIVVIAGLAVLVVAGAAAGSSSSVLVPLTG